MTTEEIIKAIRENKAYKIYKVLQEVTCKSIKRFTQRVPTMQSQWKGYKSSIGTSCQGSEEVS